MVVIIAGCCCSSQLSSVHFCRESLVGKEMKSKRGKRGGFITIFVSGHEAIMVSMWHANKLWHATPYYWVSPETSFSHEAILTRHEHVWVVFFGFAS